MTEETRIVEESTAADVAAAVEAADAETTAVSVVEAAVETAAEPVAEVTVEAEPAVEAVVEAEPAVEAVVEAEPVVETVAEATPVVEAVVEAEPAVEVVVEAEPAVEMVAEAELAVEMVAEATPVVEVVAEAEPVVEAEPVAEVTVEAEPVVKAVAEAEPVVEAVAEVEPAVEAATDAAEASAEVAVEKVAEAAENVTKAVDQVTGSAEKKNVSPKKVRSRESRSAEERKVVRLSVGQEVHGVVKRVTDFGAFVDIGAGRDGLVHISEMAVGRVNQVSDVVEVGQQLTLWIKKLDRARNRISLTLISPDTKTIKDINDGDVVPGIVSRIVPYGAFIDIGVGTDALLHVREMGNNYVAKPEDVVHLGENLDVRILSVNRRRRRIDVSLKGLRDEPEPEVAEAAEAAAALGVVEDEEVVDTFENVDVLSPMELAFKRAMEAEGVEVNTAPGKQRRGRRGKKARAVQDEIIRRTLETMKE